MDAPQDGNPLRQLSAAQLRNHVKAQMQVLFAFSEVKSTDVVSQDMYLNCLDLFDIIRERYGDELVTPAFGRSTLRDKELERVASGQSALSKDAEGGIRITAQALLSQLKIADLSLESAELEETKGELADDSEANEDTPVDEPRRLPKPRDQSSGPMPPGFWAGPEQRGEHPGVPWPAQIGGGRPTPDRAWL